MSSSDGQTLGGIEGNQDADWTDADDQDDEGTEPLPPACEGGMSGWCGKLRKHSRCYFNHPDGIAAVRAGTYGMWDGHQWVCTCPCHDRTAADDHASRRKVLPEPWTGGAPACSGRRCGWRSQGRRERATWW